MILRCEGCGERVPGTAGAVFGCPRRVELADIDHVLSLPEPTGPWPTDDDPNPFVRYRSLLGSHALARASGLTDRRFVDLVRRLDDRIAEVDGHGFVVTPFGDQPALAAAVGLGRATLAVKDETGNVAGSHKGRHLMGIALHLLVRSEMGDIAGDDLRLAIASCGNAALAASVVAAAAGWDLDVFIPTDADESVVAALADNGASITVCARRPDESGDPAYLRFGEAVVAGAVPFGCQSPDNALTIDGGRTLGYELAAQAGDHDRLYVQIGGGALASATMQGIETAVELGVLDHLPRLHPVQAEGCAPLARAYEAAVGFDPLSEAARHRGQVMWPWDSTPHSAASGILDDETYDWYRVVEVTRRSGGAPVVASEEQVVAAHRLASEHTTASASATGTAGLAGVLVDVDDIGDDERIVVAFTGRA